MQNILRHTVICITGFILVMAVFVLLNYIDLSVIKAVYLPILAAAAAAILFRQFIFGHIFIAGAYLGLVMEYIIHVNQANPTMSGAFVNTLIIVLGFIIGIFAQIAVARTRRRKVSL